MYKNLAAAFAAACCISSAFSQTPAAPAATSATVIATTPLQYIKSFRLHKARMMMLHDGVKAGAAAARVGYESNSQFSREYKRFFGSTPTDQASRFRDGQLRIIEG